jgi:peptidoglycan/LPS O-acetylase OafA/YrhL
MEAAKPLVGPRFGHAPVLDGVRGIAVLMVMLFHLAWQRDLVRTDRIVTRVFDTGWTGVDIFFVLSGFLITGILLDSRDKPHYFRNFYARRALRILPVYYLILAIFFLLLPQVLNPVPAELRELQAAQAWYWLYASNIARAIWSLPSFGLGHLWSLAIEEQFYLLWPLVVLLVPRRALAGVCIGAMVGALALRTAAVLMHEPMWVAYALTPMRMGVLAMGGLVAIRARTAEGTAWLKRWCGPAFIIAALILTAIAVYERRLDTHDSLTLSVGLSFVGLAAASIIVMLLARPESSLARGIGHPWLRWTGRVSYGAYVYHRPLILLCMPVARAMQHWARPLGSSLPAELAWMTGMIALTLLVSAASYRWFERPFLSLKDRFMTPGTAAVMPGL